MVLFWLGSIAKMYRSVSTDLVIDATADLRTKFIAVPPVWLGHGSALHGWNDAAIAQGRKQQKGQ
jgi:hypothetical protein